MSIIMIKPTGVYSTDKATLLAALADVGNDIIMSATNADGVFTPWNLGGSHVFAEDMNPGDLQMLLTDLTFVLSRDVVIKGELVPELGNDADGDAKRTTLDGARFQVGTVPFVDQPIGVAATITLKDMKVVNSPANTVFGGYFNTIMCDNLIIRHLNTFGGAHQGILVNGFVGANGPGLELWMNYSITLDPDKSGNAYLDPEIISLSDTWVQDFDIGVALVHKTDSLIVKDCIIDLALAEDQLLFGADNDAGIAVYSSSCGLSITNNRIINLVGKSSIGTIVYGIIAWGCNYFFDSDETDDPRIISIMDNWIETEPTYSNGKISGYCGNAWRWVPGAFWGGVLGADPAAVVTNAGTVDGDLYKIGEMGGISISGAAGPRDGRNLPVIIKGNTVKGAEMTAHVVVATCINSTKIIDNTFIGNTGDISPMSLFDFGWLNYPAPIGVIVEIAECGPPWNSFSYYPYFASDDLITTYTVPTFLGDIPTFLYLVPSKFGNSLNNIIQHNTFIGKVLEADATYLLSNFLSTTLLTMDCRKEYATFVGSRVDYPYVATKVLKNDLSQITYDQNYLFETPLILEDIEKNPRIWLDYFTKNCTVKLDMCSDVPSVYNDGTDNIVNCFKKSTKILKEKPAQLTVTLSQEQKNNFGRAIKNKMRTYGYTEAIMAHRPIK